MCAVFMGQTALCLRLRELLESPVVGTADNCVLAALQNTNPVSLVERGKSIIAGACAASDVHEQPAQSQL
jgi:hypothetical protein